MGGKRTAGGLDDNEHALFDRFVAFCSGEIDHDAEVGVIGIHIGASGESEDDRFAKETV